MYKYKKYEKLSHYDQYEKYQMYSKEFQSMWIDEILAKENLKVYI